MKKLNLIWIIGILIISNSFIVNADSIYEQQTIKDNAFNSWASPGDAFYFETNDTFQLTNIEIYGSLRGTAPSEWNWALRSSYTGSNLATFKLLSTDFVAEPTWGWANVTWITGQNYTLNASTTYYIREISGDIGSTNNGFVTGLDYQGKLQSDHGACWDDICIETQRQDCAGTFKLYGIPTSTGANNFTVSAQGTDGEGSLSSFNVSIIGDNNYSTSGSTITTGLLDNSTSLWNITVSKTGYSDITYNNWNVSSNLVANLTALSLNDFNIITPNQSNTRNTSYNITWDEAVSPANFNVEYNVTISFLNNTIIESHLTNNTWYNLDETNYTIGNYSVNVKATEEYSNNTFNHTNYLLIKPISDYFKVTAYNYLGTSLISNIITQEEHVGSTQTSNPYEYDIYEYLHSANYTQNETAVLNITDLSYKHSDYSGNVTVTRYDNWFDINMTPNQLFFTFYQAGSLTSTQGWIADDVQSQRFENSTWLIIQQELSDGYVHARFGTTDGVNHTQYYEYINDYTVHIEEDIEVLVQADWSGYIRALDYAGSPIKDATIRAYYSFNQVNATDHELLGQRLTDDGGYTFFWFDSRTEILLEITKSGYDPIYALITIGDEAYTKTSPLDFYMKTGSDTFSDGNSWVYVKRGFTNRSLDLHGTIMTKNKELVEITTDYRESEGLSRKTLISDELERYAFTLVSGSDFSLTTTDDITLYVYLDNELWRTINVDYDTSDKTRTFNMPETVSDILIGIALIFLTVLAGLIFKFQTIGKWTFIIGGVFTGFLSTTYLWVSFICGAYLIFRIVKGVIGE
jgi:hypothetical protein